MSGPLRMWLIDVEEKTDDDPPTVRLLKMANQRVMFPAFWCLKSKLRIPTMRDKRGTWHINFVIRKDGAEVIHTKTQLLDNASSPMKEEGEFEIALILRMSPLPSCENLDSVHMEIRNVVLAADLSSAARDAWQLKFDQNHIIQ